MTPFVFLLTVVLVMPEGQQDLSRDREVASIDDCMAAARDWLAQDPHVHGAIGLAASCQIVDRPKS